MGIKVDRQKFWQGYHKSFDAYGPTTQATVDSLNFILDRFETEQRLKNIPQFSYCLGTWYHETGIDGNHFVPVREKKAGPRSEVWQKYQSKYWNTGFFGRGLDQTTFEPNYRKVGEALGLGDAFVKNPDLLLKIEYAYDGAVSGMVSGRYRADKNKQRYSLPRFFKDDDASLQEYFEARDIINGDKNRVVNGKKNGILIAETAEKFENLLRRTMISQSSAVADSQPEETDISTAASTSDGQAGKPEELQPPTNNEPPQAPGQTIVDVPPVITETEPGIVSKIKGWHAALPGFVVTFLGGVWSWLQGAATEIILGFFGAAALIGMTWIIAYFILKNKREARQFDAEQKQKERDFELTKLQLQSAMDPNKQTVRVAPPPVEIPSAETVGT